MGGESTPHAAGFREKKWLSFRWLSFLNPDKAKRL
jgi:hypothetical protein